MGIAEIDEYIAARIKNPDGTWRSDAKECIAYVMENRYPSYSSSIEEIEEYGRLIECAIKYLRENPNDEEFKKKVQDTVIEDARMLFNRNVPAFINPNFVNRVKAMTTRFLEMVGVSIDQTM